MKGAHRQKVSVQKNIMEVKNIKDLLNAYTRGTLVKGDYNVRQNKHTRKERTKRILPLFEGKSVSLNVYAGKSFEVADIDSWLTLDAILVLFGGYNSGCSAFVNDYGAPPAPLVFEEGEVPRGSINGQTIYELNNKFENSKKLGTYKKSQKHIIKRFKLGKPLCKGTLIDYIKSIPVNVIVIEGSLSFSKREKGKLAAEDITNSWRKLKTALENDSANTGTLNKHVERRKLYSRSYINAFYSGSDQLAVLKDGTSMLDSENCLPDKISFNDSDFRDLFFTISLVGARLYPDEELTLNRVIRKVLEAPVGEIKSALDEIILFYANKNFRDSCCSNGGIIETNSIIAVAFVTINGISLKNKLTKEQKKAFAAISENPFYKKRGQKSYRKEIQYAKSLVASH